MPGKHRCTGSSEHSRLPKSAYQPPTVGWPKDHPVPSDMFYSACAKLPNKARMHPLDNVGFEATITIENSSKEINDNSYMYVENLRKLIDERKAALTEIERSMHLDEAQPGIEGVLGEGKLYSGSVHIHPSPDHATIMVTINQGRMCFPVRELDEIISKLVNPATITMQAMSR